jgi:hypothetical protein
MRLSATSLVFLMLSLERLTNAAMLHDPANVSAAVRLSGALGIASVVSLLVGWLQPLVAKVGRRRRGTANVADRARPMNR